MRVGGIYLGVKKVVGLEEALAESAETWLERVDVS